MILLVELSNQFGFGKELLAEKMLMFCCTGPRKGVKKMAFFVILISLLKKGE